MKAHSFGILLAISVSTNAQQPDNTEFACREAGGTPVTTAHMGTGCLYAAPLMEYSPHYYAGEQNSAGYSYGYSSYCCVPAGYGRHFYNSNYAGRSWYAGGR